eukprot:m.22557 g.22557  ORF g.22557 m.22557 type:complete len:403 (+) comp10765_c0_seq1:24-1232(+)
MWGAVHEATDCVVHPGKFEMHQKCEFSHTIHTVSSNRASGREIELSRFRPHSLHKSISRDIARKYKAPRSKVPVGLRVRESNTQPRDTMPKMPKVKRVRPRKKFWACGIGRRPGVYTEYLPELVLKYKYCEHKSFETEAEAKKYVASKAERAIRVAMLLEQATPSPPGSPAQQIAGTNCEAPNHDDVNDETNSVATESDDDEVRSMLLNVHRTPQSVTTFHGMRGRPYISEAVLQFMGGCWDNPGCAGASAILLTRLQPPMIPGGYWHPDVSPSLPFTEVVATSCIGFDWATDTEAQYVGLILGLQLALNCGVTSLRIIGDSALVHKQVTGEFRVKAERLQPLSQIVTSLLDVLRVDRTQLEYVQTHRHPEASRLMTAAMNNPSLAFPDCVAFLNSGRPLTM